MRPGRRAGLLGRKGGSYALDTLGREIVEIVGGGGAGTVVAEEYGGFTVDEIERE